jgi:hypothetical protein
VVWFLGGGSARRISPSLSPRISNVAEQRSEQFYPVLVAAITAVQRSPCRAHQMVVELAVGLGREMVSVELP